MARGEDGEFELILGNRQLLSVFFIVVVLLGVFFTMGYIVGKNSVSPTEMAARKSDPIVVDPSSSRKPSSFGNEKKSDALKPSDLQELNSPLPMPEPRQTEPKKEAKAEPPPKQEPVVETSKKEAKKESRKEAKKAEPEPPPVVKPPAQAAPPGPGQTFLQVVASSKPDCEIIADVLKRKGFAASVVPGPNEKVFRVVVGPLADAGTISRTRSELEQAGFQKPVVRKF